ncbi:hypothetical protein [Rubellicoccus peritrichatus]|uniref:Uncharacterized protein n=1 Tax=Rubellicoccus peritrichatus TaxID=3080537 RepID=A0AAQ3LD68_9BACT|nr:hypothetical protein [Puniceicoccus sp. CR14]WOO42337.1 hypothetical protein RZN69_04490 [Puniceicoccus sp. CR14]
MHRRPPPPPPIQVVIVLDPRQLGHPQMHVPGVHGNSQKNTRRTTRRHGRTLINESLPKRQPTLDKSVAKKEKPKSAATSTPQRSRERKQSPGSQKQLIHFPRKGIVSAGLGMAATIVIAGTMMYRMISADSVSEASYVANVVEEEVLEPTFPVEIPQASGPLSIEDIFARYAAAHGGTEQLSEISSLKLRGQVQSNGRTLNFSQIKRTPNLTRVSYQNDEGKVTDYYNGSVAWRRVQGHENAYRLDDASKKDFEESSALLSTFWTERNNIHNYAMLEQGKIGHKQYYRIGVHNLKGKSSIYWIDSDTFFERRMVTQQEDGSIETIDYSDYKYIGALPVPMHIEYSHDNKLVTTVDIDSASINAGIPSSLFDPPLNLEDWPVTTVSAQSH